MAIWTENKALRLFHIDAKKRVLKCSQEVVSVSLLHYVLVVFHLFSADLVSGVIFGNVSEVNLLLLLLMLLDLLLLLDLAHPFLVNPLKPL